MTWRPLPGEPAPARPVRASLERVVAGLGSPPVDVLTVLFEHWVEVAGAELAAHSRPLALRDGRLVVGVVEPAWATAVRYGQQALLERLEGLVGRSAAVCVEVRVRPADAERDAPIRRG